MDKEPITVKGLEKLKKTRNQKDLNLKYGKNLILMMKVVVNLEFYIMD